MLLLLALGWHFGLWDDAEHLIYVNRAENSVLNLKLAQTFSNDFSTGDLKLAQTVSNDFSTNLKLTQTVSNNFKFPGFKTPA
jgi:hypothetical protein